MNVNAFNLSVQGASHIKRGKECQDSSKSFTSETVSVAVVCDGHGGNDYVRSKFGSEYASMVAVDNIRLFTRDADCEQLDRLPERYIMGLEKSIISGWGDLICAHFDSHPFLDEELGEVSEKARKKYMEDGRIESAYGTTLIATAMTEEYCFGIQVGDGRCVAVSAEGEFYIPIPDDPKCFLNETTSICDFDAIENFRYFYEKDNKPAAVFVCSDGVDDSFQNEEQLFAFYRTILCSFAVSEFDKAKAELEDYLPRFSEKGSGDDISIAVIIDFDLLHELDFVKKHVQEN